MLSTTETITANLLDELQALKASEPQLLPQLSLCVQACKRAMQSLKEHMRSQPFSDVAEEILFFKTAQPALFSELIYYTRLFWIETHRPTGSNKVIRKYLKNEQEKIHYFFANNQDFYKYFRTGATHFDSLYFRRHQDDSRILPADLVLAIDSEYCTVQSYKAARLLANEKLLMYLNEAMLQHEQQFPGATITNQPELTWTGSKVALIELIYAMQTSQVLNSGQADIKLLTGFFERIFNTQLGNVYHVFQEMRLRKKNRTSFLDQLRERLVERMDLADER